MKLKVVLTFFLVLSSTSYAQSVNKTCQALSEAKNWFEKIDIQGSISRSGTMNVHFANGNGLQTFPISLLPLTSSGGGMRALVKNVYWPLALTIDDNGVDAELIKLDEPEQVYFFKCQNRQ